MYKLFIIHFFSFIYFFLQIKLFILSHMMYCIVILYVEPKWKLYTFIIQIANTILNQCISLCLYKIGRITKAIICLKLKSFQFVMHNREITHIVKTEFIKNSIGWKDQMFFLLPFERKLCQNYKQKKLFMKIICNQTFIFFRRRKYIALRYDWFGLYTQWNPNKPNTQKTWNHSKNALSFHLYWYFHLWDIKSTYIKFISWSRTHLLPCSFNCDTKSMGVCL